MIESKVDLEGGEDRELWNTCIEHRVIDGLEVLRSERKVSDRYLNKHTSQGGINSLQCGACYP